MAEGDTLWNAAIGAVVTVALSFTGFSPLLGGGIAGYLQEEPPNRGAKVGAISGLIASVPVLLILVAGFVLFVGMPSRMGLPGAAELVVVLLIFVLLFAWNIALSTVGGYLGAYIRSDAQQSSEETAPSELG